MATQNKTLKLTSNINLLHESTGHTICRKVGKTVFVTSQKMSHNSETKIRHENETVAANVEDTDSIYDRNQWKEEH